MAIRRVARGAGAGRCRGRRGARVGITVFFQDVTTPGLYALSATVRDAAGRALSVLPARRLLAHVVGPDSRTLVFSCQRIRPGVPYQLFVSAGVTRTVPGSASIRTSDVLVVVDAVPG